MLRQLIGGALLGLALLLAASPMAHAATPQGRERILMDAGWRFYRGDPSGRMTGIPIAHWRWKAADRGEASASEMADPGLATVGTDWQDASPDEDTFHGRRGYSWYRATLGNVPGPHRLLHFESVDDNATVYLNGQRLLAHAGWDEPFDVPLDRAWKEGGPNMVAVLVQNTNGRGGIGAAQLQTAETATPEAARVGFDDRKWRTVHLPHDFVVEGTFTPQADGSHGFLPKDIGWYRKTFTLPASDRGRQLWIDFDGIYRNSTVWLNGHWLGTHPSGYTSFRYDITEVANYGGANVLAVRADARASEGWWYEGGGIYRHVWLNKADPLHVAPWGTFVASTVSDPNAPDPETAALTVTTTLTNSAATKAACTLVSAIQAPDGRMVAQASRSVEIPAGASQEVMQPLTLQRPQLWSLETPRLYRLLTRVERQGRTVDSVVTPFGIRTIRFDPDKGFFLNGKPVKIKGTCNHQDFAGVGIALTDSLLAWRIKKLKEMGSNAYRCSHNPPTAELLDACDRLGMLVMDENRHLGDTYRDHSSPGTPYSDLSDLASMIQRDRNHPSIIMWSMCNEEGLQSTEEGARIFTAMMRVVHRYDTTRPITCAMNFGWGQGISRVEDLQGCNYNPDAYDAFHQAHPTMPMFGSETASAVGDRGIYGDDPVRGYVNAYDLRPGGGWANTAEQAWQPIAERPFMAGCFVWTGFDYRGEPTPYGWPCINSHFGIMDMCGFPKDAYYYYQAWWGDKPVVHVFPHWNWPGKEGQPIEVWCYSNCDQVELFLNGQSLGVKAMPRNGHVAWQVPYAPGRLEARGYSAGRVIASDAVETTGPPAQLRLTPDRTTLTADGEDTIPVAVEVLDAQGRLVPTADNLVGFHVRGSARIAGVGNGDPSSHEPNKAPQRRAFNGKCMVLIQAGDHPGPIQVTATAPGLKPASVPLVSLSGRAGVTRWGRDQFERVAGKDSVLNVRR